MFDDDVRETAANELKSGRVFALLPGLDGTGKLKEATG